MSSHFTDLNTRNKPLTAKLINLGYWYHKLRNAFSKFYRHDFDFVSNFNVGLKSLLPHDLSEFEFYGDLYLNSAKDMLAMVLALNFVYKDWVQQKCNTTDYMHGS